MGKENTSKQAGRPAKYSDEVYLGAISELAEDDCEIVISVANIHTRLTETDKKITKRAVYRRLNSLREKNLVERREVSPEFHTWKLTESGEETLEAARREDGEEDDEGGERDD